MDEHMPQAAPPPETDAQLKHVRYTLPPNPEDATVYYKNTITKAQFTVNGPPQWVFFCKGDVRVGVDKMQSLKKFAPHDLLPISVELKFQPSEHKDICYHIQGYRVLQLKVVDDQPTNHRQHFRERLLDDAVGDYASYKLLMKASVQGSNAQETEMETAMQLSYSVMHRWLHARKRWLVQTSERARTDLPPYLMVVYPDSDFRHSHEVPPQPPYTQAQSVKNFYTQHDLSTSVQEACLAANFSPKTRKGIQQCFGQNALATLISRQFHPMDATEVCLRMGLNSKDVSYPKWRSQVDAFVNKIISPSHSFQRPFVLAHLWLNPYHRNLELGNAVNFEACVHALFQLAWLQPTSARASFFKRFTHNLRKNLLQEGKKRKRKRELEIPQLQYQIDQLEALDKSSFLGLISRYTYRLAPSQLRNSFYMRGKAMLYLCPPLRGLAWARREAFDCKIPPVVVDSPYLLTAPLAQAALQEGTPLLSPGYSLKDPRTGDNLLHVDPHTSLATSCRKLLHPVLQLWNQAALSQRNTPLNRDQAREFAKALFRTCTTLNFPVDDLFVTVHQLLRHTSVLDTLKFTAHTLEEAAELERSQARLSLHSLGEPALQVIQEFSPQPFETNEGKVALKNLYHLLEKAPTPLPAGCVVVARLRKKDQPDEFEWESDSDEPPPKKSKLGEVFGLNATELPHAEALEAKTMLSLVPSRKAEAVTRELCQEAFEEGQTPALSTKQKKTLHRAKHLTFHLRLPFQDQAQVYRKLPVLLDHLAQFKREQACNIVAYCRHFYLWEGPLYHFRLHSHTPVVGSTWFHLYQATHNHRVVDAFIDLVASGIERAFATVIATSGVDSISPESLSPEQVRKVTGCLSLLESKGTLLSHMALRTLQCSKETA